jgi:hypothetical protein
MVIFARLKTLTSMVAFEAGMPKSQYDAYAFPTRDASRRLGRRPIFREAQRVRIFEIEVELEEKRD